MRYDPTSAQVDLAAQLILQGFTFEDIAEIAAVTEHREWVEKRVTELRNKRREDPTQRAWNFSTTEKRVRKLAGFDFG